MDAPLVNTPHYVLLDGKHRIGPPLVSPRSGQECVAIYGFSDKHPYDAFCSQSELALTPYPLVKGYLRNQLEVARNAILLIVVDAAGPNALQLNAATMQSVLESQVNQSKHVAVSFRLTRDEQSKAYHLEESLPDLVSP
ncbi:hypothetical protein Poly41_62550 [Novipirellula artificiosorum]|uniref:Uncharacterized protein n=2 Tax=Novipirellula artificiosorum TaxID=2528016 RepID=A0A5C6D828_9BACT|nr:hypothetical protein Poly41_62550 [Novipirellula artificiosorum]